VTRPEAVHSGHPYRPEWELELLDMERVYRYLAQGRWFRQVSKQGQFSLGDYRYGIGVAFANQMVDIAFDAYTQEFLCQSEDAKQTVRLAAQGLTKTDLLGELGSIVALPAYQLALPFSIAKWRQMELCLVVNG
jgi:hypothetical protein